MVAVRGEECHHAGAEILRNHHCCIVFAGFGAVDGLFFGGEGPVHLVVGAQGVDHLIADTDLHGNEIGLVAFIVVGDGEFQIAGVGEWIPACAHVEPGEQARNYHQSDDDDDGDDVAGQASNVADEQFPDVFHALLLSLLPLGLVLLAVPVLPVAFMACTSVAMPSASAWLVSATLAIAFVVPCASACLA